LDIKTAGGLKIGVARELRSNFCYSLIFPLPWT